MSLSASVCLLLSEWVSFLLVSGGLSMGLEHFRIVVAYRDEEGLLGWVGERVLRHGA